MRDFAQPRRSAAIAAHAMAATSHPLATLTALDVLRGGGNAVDAALATVAVLNVVEPQMTGIGGDCFVLYSKAGALPLALNGSGRAPMKANVEWYRANGIRAIEVQTPHAVSVPGAVDAWCRLHADHATKDLAELMEPAAKLAEEGHAVTPRVAADFASSFPKIMADADAGRVFAPGGRPIGLGETMKQPALAKTLRKIGKQGRAGFYEGEVAAEIVAKLQRLGGLHTLEDFALQRCDYVTPISTNYRGYDVFECPPNGQGLAALMILSVLAGYDIGDKSTSEADRIHLLAEAAKAAYAVRDAFFADPKQVNVAVDRYLSADYAKATRAKIHLDRARDPVPWDARDAIHKDTVYFCIVDRDGNAISFINSLFHDFGSGILAPGCGVLLHNRAISFRIDEKHPNAIAPGKRPLHTIIPGLALRAGRPALAFGVMGGHYQPVGHVQILTNLFEYGQDPQTALDGPRSFAYGGELQIETGVPAATAQALARRGHKVVARGTPLGGGQIIMLDHERGVLLGGSDPRKDGLALGY
jgi:gamma-glutamyltranspeptidase/glutathione hydrolase